MIRRFVCLLLVPLMLVSQGPCFAHSHHGTGMAEPDGHASRPHFHTGGHRHHADHSCRDHRHGPRDAALPPAIAPVGDHDADAVYCADVAALACGGNSAIVLSAKHVAAAVVLRVAEPSDDRLLRLGQPLSIFDVDGPTYLRTRSLRI